MKLSAQQQRFLQEHAPCYLYDANIIREKCRQLKQALPNVTFLFSVKTNPFPPVLRLLREEGLGADAASPAEVKLAQEAGMPQDTIFYSSPGKTDRDLEATLGTCVFTADSLGELRRLQALAEAQGKHFSVGVRLDPAEGMDGGPGSSNKFGIDEEQLDELAEVPNACPNLTVNGVHIHQKSQILDAAVLGAYYRRCFALAQKLAGLTGGKLDFVNFGSGLGTVYDASTQTPLDLIALAKAFRAVEAENDKTLRARLYCETGRFVTCHSGVYAAPIVDKKTSCGKTYLMVAGGMNGFFRPAMAALLERVCGGAVPAEEPLATCPDAFPITVLGSSRETETVTVAGGLCTGLDVLCADKTLPKGEVGDIVVLGNAGSYGYSLSPLAFSSHEPPEQVLWEEPET